MNHFFICFKSYWIFQNKVSRPVWSIFIFLFFYCRSMQVYTTHFDMCLRRVTRPVNLLCIFFGGFSKIFIISKIKVVWSISSFLFYCCQSLQFKKINLDIYLRRVTWPVNLLWIHVFISFQSYWIIQNKVCRPVSSIIFFLFSHCQLLQVYKIRFCFCLRRVTRPVSLL